jgi:hypothetical protein
MLAIIPPLILTMALSGRHKDPLVLVRVARPRGIK